MIASKIKDISSNLNFFFNFFANPVVLMSMQIVCPTIWSVSNYKLHFKAVY